MKLKNLTTLVLLITTIFINAQTNPLRLNPNIILPKDSIQSKALISNLNDFLVSAQKPNIENKFVLETEKVETFILLDEINGIEKSGKFKDDYFYKPYLTNIVSLNENQYLVQVSYIGVNENNVMLRTSFEFIAHKSDQSFLFSSPLLLNTKNWKVEKIGNTIFHYQNTLNKANAKEFNKLATLFDKKLKSETKITEFYCCENLTEIQKLIGVQYKSDYNGRTSSVWNSSNESKQIILLGNKNANFDNFDPHDLWHDRLSLVIPRNKVNRSVDEGCAYIYGGSWGLSWKEIFKEFKLQIASNKKTDWTEIKENPVNFKSKEFNNSADNIVNSLLIQKIEKEKGFAGVWELLNSGKIEKGNVSYYNVLEKLTGITKQNYNDKIWELINSEK
ncbi:hypothetical protein [Flavobacterium sp. ZB4P13]|uniref:hypothetical protein n=1 Tax=Flavobacterium sp. ZB4P13 TaxID=3401728 RepID=UPI003AAB65FA